MELKFLVTILGVFSVTVPHSYCRPGISIRQVRRNLNQIWKDYDGKRRKKKMRIRAREVKTAYDLDGHFSNCRAVRLKPSNNCRLLVYKNGVLFGSNQKLSGDEGVFQIEVYGKDLIRLKYVPNGLYIMMNKHGKINAISN